MVPQILALTFNGGGPDGGTVDIGSWPFIVGSLPFVVVITLIVMLTWYFLNKKRLEHQQILAAIEKGTPLSELMPVVKKGSDWIKNLTGGITSLLIGSGLIIITLLGNNCIFGNNDMGLFIAIVLLAVGISRILRGILQRKADKDLSSENLALNANKGQ